MAKIRYSEASEQDLEDIGDYIEKELKSQKAAFDTTTHIQDAIDELEYAPHIGLPLAIRYGNVGDYRYLISGNYLVFYRVQANVVYIDRILYGKRDYLGILFGKLTDG